MFLMLYLIYTRAITVGQFFSLFIYSFFIFGPLQELGNIINIYRETEASLNIYEEILQMPKEPKPANPAPLDDLRTLAFEHVSFQHQSASSPAVSDISFRRDARRDDRVRRAVGRRQDDAGQAAGRALSAAVGADPLQRHSGSTRSTSNGLRARIGFVTQDTQLFSGTIRENLLFVNPAATDEECLDVLRKAACDSLLARADRGLDTVIGEGGVKVSGGEKQRLSIARALLRRPHLLVFDEATSSLDSLTEEGIAETIRDVADERRRDDGPDRAPALDHPARRPHLRARARPHRRDRRPRQLLEQKGLYYAMWRQQIGERRGVEARRGGVAREPVSRRLPPRDTPSEKRSRCEGASCPDDLSARAPRQVCGFDPGFGCGVGPGAGAGFGAGVGPGAGAGLPGWLGSGLTVCLPTRFVDSPLPPSQQHEQQNDHDDGDEDADGHAGFEDAAGHGAAAQRDRQEHTENKTDGGVLHDASALHTRGLQGRSIESAYKSHARRGRQARQPRTRRRSFHVGSSRRALADGGSPSSRLRSRRRADRCRRRNRLSVSSAFEP